MSEPATKSDLLELRADLRTEFHSGLSSLRTEFRSDLQELRTELRTEFRSDLAAQKDELIEAFRDGQTELLKAFYGFMETIQNRFKDSDQTEASLRTRMTTLERRMLEVEKRLSMPPGVD